jgi:hypothetical protein
MKIESIMPTIDYFITDIMTIKPYIFINNIMKNYNYKIIEKVYKKNPSILYQLGNNNNSSLFKINVDNYDEFINLLNGNKEVFNLLINVPNNKLDEQIQVPQL